MWLITEYKIKPKTISHNAPLFKQSKLSLKKFIISKFPNLKIYIIWQKQYI